MKNYFGYLVDRLGQVLPTQLFSDAQLRAGMAGVPALGADGGLVGPTGAALGMPRLAALPAAPVDAVAEAFATDTLTSSGVNVGDGETVAVAGKAYTFKAALTPTEGQVLIGADADGSLANLAAAIDHAGVPGTDYSCAAQNAGASSSGVDAHALTFTARAAGAAGNALGLSTTAATLTPGDAHFAGGVDGVAGTPGAVNQVGAFGGQPYYCTADADAATAGAWKKLTLGAL